MINPDHKDGRYLVPREHDLRYVERETPEGTVRVIQQYTWSYTLSEFGWFDIPLEKEI